MSLFNALKTDDSIDNEKDFLGGFQTLESGIYKAIIELAYVTTSGSGALGLNVVAKTAKGETIRDVIYMTSGTAKGGNNFYVDKDGKKQYLPGFNLANSLSLLTTGSDIGGMTPEDKVIKLRNKEANAEVPTQVPMFTELLGQEVYIAVMKQLVDKTKKGDDGVYRPTGETMNKNVIDKFFRAKDKLTTAEVRAGETEATFFDRWETKNAGNVQDMTTKGVGTPGIPGKAAAVAANKPQKSLFGAAA